MKVAITGANGFLGSNLVKFLKKENIYVREIQRKPNRDSVQISSINSCTNWDLALKDIDIIVHCAGNAHNISQSKNMDLINSFEMVSTNLYGTIRLAKSCIKNKVKKIIYISSIKVLGEKTTIDNPFTNYSEPDPKDIYAWTKLKSEESIKEICLNTETSYTIIRPPLLFGPGVKANFERLIKLVNLQIPLPFGSINNKRSLMHVENLSSFIHKCMVNKESENQTFVVCDNNFSTKDLIKKLAASHNKNILIFKFPKIVLWFCFLLIGRGNEFKKLFNSLLINPEESFQKMNWNPKNNFMISNNKKLKTFSK